jgi:hypothetical protein
LNSKNDLKIIGYNKVYMVVNYQLGKIYKIVCNETGLIYVGSTCEPTLAKRLTKHRNDYKCWLNDKKRYMTSYKILEKGNYNIILIEDYPCDRREQLLAKERKYIEEIDCVNKFIPTRTQKEYYKANTDEIKEKSKIYYEANAEKIKEYKKDYNEINAEKIKEYQKEYQKKYREMKKLEQKDNIC